MAIIIDQSPQPKERKPSIVYNMKRYENELNEDLAALAPQDIIDMMGGKATEKEVMRHYHNGSLGALVRIYDEKQFKASFLVWYDKKQSQLKEK